MPLMPSFTTDFLPRGVSYPSEGDRGQTTAIPPQGTRQNNFHLDSPFIPNKFLLACSAHQRLLPFLGIQDNSQLPRCIGPPLSETRSPERLHQGPNEPTTPVLFRGAPLVASQLCPIRQEVMGKHRSVPGYTERAARQGTRTGEEKAFTISQPKRPRCRRDVPKDGTTCMST